MTGASLLEPMKEDIEAAMAYTASRSTGGRMRCYKQRDDEQQNGRRGMAVEQYPVEVQSDFLEKITGGRPVPALAELDN